jgi:competence protein ComEA
LIAVGEARRHDEQLVSARRHPLERERAVGRCPSGPRLLAVDQDDFGAADAGALRVDHTTSQRGLRRRQRGQRQNGAEGTEQELETVLQYLSTQFPVEAQKALNLNTATAIDLESVAGLLRKEAAAVIAYREKNGPCRKLEDLKKITGLDYKKIEARKERLACM